MAKKESLLMTNADAKRWLRAYLIKKRQSLGPERQKKLSRAIVRHVLRSREFRQAKVIATYIGFASEVLTNGLIKAAWRRGQRLLIPITRSGFDAPFFALLKKNDWLQKTAYGPFELVEKKKPFDFRTIDLVIVPGLGVDGGGYRLGYGGGVYDRLLEKTPRAKHIGLFFGIQRLNKIPRASHDRPLRRVCTEKGCETVWQKGRSHDYNAPLFQLRKREMVFSLR